MDQLDTHPLRGNIFENFVVSEYLKKLNNAGTEINLYFWRDQKGHEVDLIEDRSTCLFPIEIKLSETFHSSFIRNILYLNKLQGDEAIQSKVKGNLIYSGDNESVYKNIQLRNWLSTFRGTSSIL